MDMELLVPLPAPGSKDAKADVVISGAGPVGLLMGCLLKQAGIDVALVDPHVFPAQGSKAAATMPRSFEQMELAGVGSELLDLGRPLERARVCLGGGAWTGEISGFKSSTMSRHCPRTVGQNFVEAELTKRYRALGGRFYRGARFVSHSEIEGGVVVAIKHAPYVRPPAVLPSIPAAATAVMDTQIEAKYLIGCDGKQSAVRKAMGASYDGHDYKETFLLADVEVPEEQVVHLAWDHGLNAIIDSASGSFLLFIRLQATRWRTYYCAKGLTQDSLTPEFIQERWRQLVPPPGPFKPTEFKDMAFFEVSCKLASSFQKGRVLLSGDAAHCHSPAGGQGMNTGLQDSANLAWKLASVLQGHAPEALLSSYETERKPVAVWVLNGSDAAFQGVTTQRSAIWSEVRRLFLKTVFSLAPEDSLPPKFLFNKISGLGISYQDNGTCQALGYSPGSSSIRAGDRLSDAECLEADSQGTKKTFALQLFNSAPRTALRLMLVANVSKGVPENAEVEQALSRFKALATKGLPIQPVLYMSNAPSVDGCIGCFAGLASGDQRLTSRSVEFRIGSEVLAGFEKYRSLTCIGPSSSDIAVTMGLRAGGRGLLVVRPDGYIAVSQMDVAGRGHGWNMEPVVDALRRLHYVL